MTQTASWSGTFESLRDYKNIPGPTLQDIINYVIDGRATGNFLMAVLSNNLSDCFRHGDPSNLRALWAITTFLYNRCPAGCWGDTEKVKRWPGYRSLMTGIVIPDTSLEQVISDWRKNAIEGTVLDVG